MKYKVTVAIPIYNVAAYVKNSVLSALNQTFKSIEYILVDDKGTDNSMDIVRAIIADHPRRQDVRIIEHSENIGLGAGRNTAIDHAMGEYIYFMDSDDEIVSDCIEVLYNKMQEQSVDFVAASVVKKDREGNILDKFVHKDEFIIGSVDIPYLYFKSKKRFVNTWNKLYNLSFLRNNKIKCISSHLNEDNLFTFQIVLNASSCRYISDITYCYYDTPNSIVNITGDNYVSIRYAKQYVECITFKKDYIKKYSNSKVREAVFRYIIFQTNYYALKIARSEILTKTEKQHFLVCLLKYPLQLSDINIFKDKSLFYFMYLVYKLPFTMSILKIIDKI